MEKPKLTTVTLWSWVKAICTLLLVGVLAYKIFMTPVELTVDFPTLLSLLLALFSVGLAALFYFKATDTSNTFYDNTYNFTKDIAQLLVKMESGFGERLRHLDEGYSSMRDYLQTSPKQSGQVEETKKKIESEKQEIDKVVSERNQIINQLIERSQLHTEEKEQVLRQLQEKEKSLEEAQKDLSRMKKRLFMERMRHRNIGDSDLDTGFARFTETEVIPKLGIEKILHGSMSALRHDFNHIADELPRGYIEDLERHGYFSDGLTRSGIEFLRKLAERIDA